MIFDRNFFRGWGNVDRELYGKHARHMMKTDVKEVENGYEVDIDLPGFKKDEITLGAEGWVPDHLGAEGEHAI